MGGVQVSLIIIPKKSRQIANTFVSFSKLKERSEEMKREEHFVGGQLSYYH